MNYYKLGGIACVLVAMWILWPYGVILFIFFYELTQGRISFDLGELYFLPIIFIAIGGVVLFIGVILLKKGFIKNL